MPLSLSPRVPRLSERPSNRASNKTVSPEYQRKVDKRIETAKKDRTWLAGFFYGVFFGFVLLIFLLVTGCAATKHHPPQITDVSNADSLVRVSIHNAKTGGIMGMLWPPEHEIQAKGEEGCQIFGKPAVRLGAKCVEYWSADQLYCKTAEILFAGKTTD